jgi:hypothetical protein
MRARTSARCAGVSALRGRQDPAVAERVTDAKRGADLGRDVLTSRHADEFDDVHRRLGRVTGEGVGQPGLAEPAGADDGDHPRSRHERPEAFQVGVAADERGRVVPDAAADGAVEGQQPAMGALEGLAGIAAEALAQVPAVGLEPVEGRGRTADGGFAAQEVGEQCLVVRLGVVGGFKDREGL